MRIKTYNPKDKIHISKEEALPLLINVGEKFTNFGNLLSFFISSFLLSIKTFFRTKKKVREIIGRHEKTLDLRQSRGIQDFICIYLQSVVVFLNLADYDDIFHFFKGYF